MKKLTLTVLCGTLVLWVGYLLGYHQGAKDEQKAWFSTAKMERVDRGDHEILYRNPHVGLFVSSPAQTAVNVPDPRTYTRYGHPLPFE